jgi:hypothetical protein
MPNITPRTAVATAVAAVPLALLLTPGTASASDEASSATVVTCAATNVFNYSPGLLLTTRPVTAAEATSYALCVGGGVSSGSSGGSSVRTLGCLNLGESNSGSITITWNDGTTSRFTGNQTVVNVAGQAVVVRTGSITEGKFQGATAVQEILAPSLNLLDCVDEPGITSKTGVGTL